MCVKGERMCVCECKYEGKGVCVRNKGEGACVRVCVSVRVCVCKYEGKGESAIGERQLKRWTMCDITCRLVPLDL